MTLPEFQRMEAGDEAEDEDEENEELLSALERSLTDETLHVDMRGPACLSEVIAWPMEVRLLVASFLPWREVVARSLLCRAWRRLELEDMLWKDLFCQTWPRLLRRQQVTSSQPWRAHFRARWAAKARCEDAVEEDWLDFLAASDPVSEEGAAVARETAPARLNEALKRCREALQLQDPDGPGHSCTKRCRYQKLGIEGYDAFMCEDSGALHECRPDLPCEFCVATADESFLVCPVSGRCFQKLQDIDEEALGAADATTAILHAHDAELGAAQHFESWFEQGYSLSEDQAKDFFGTGFCSALKCRQ